MHVSVLRVRCGENDLLHTEDGRTLIDVVTSTGAVFLGHANAAVNRHVVDQMARVSSSWTAAMEVQDRCKEQVAGHVGEDLRLHSLYSSGMEAAEVALRIAFHETRRPGIIGFRNDHHGRSVATQSITGADADLPSLPGFVSLPFLPDHSEADALAALRVALEATPTAAVFVEPMQGRGGGHAAGADFHRALQGMCRDAGALVVCDEIFTGMYRTGDCFLHPALGLEPDIVLVGKALANGFPAAGVLLRTELDYHPRDFRLSSTFSDNPLACAAVVGTSSEMERIDVATRVAHIEQVLGGLRVGPTSRLRLRGAACFVELPSPMLAGRVHDHLLDHGVLALRRDAVLGLLPPATITADHLDQVVAVTNEGLEAVA